MATTGIGIIPGGAPGAEATAFTRRAFVGKMVVQTRNATPALAAFVGNAKPATGGVSSVTVPMQGGSYVNTVSTDYSGKFPPPDALAPGVNAEWNLKAIITPIPFLGMEGIVQWDAAIIPILAARMNDAGQSAAEYLSTQMWNNATYGSQDIDGFPLIASATGTYAGLSRSTNTWLQANVISAGSSVTPTRELLNQYIVSYAKFAQGEMPDFILTGPGTWSLLSKQFIGVENYRITPNGQSFDQLSTGPRSAFTALMVAGVPVYPDHAYGTEGTFYFFKRKYMSFYIHQALAWAFTGFQSTLANYQLGYVGALVTVLELVNVKPKSVTKVTGFASDTV